MQRWSLRMGSPSRQEKAYRDFVRQNDFARKYGLRILILIYNLFLGYVLVALVFWSAVMLLSGGYLTLPSQR